MIDSQSIQFYDTQAIFTILSSMSWAAIVGAITSISLDKLKVDSMLKKVVQCILVIWVITTVGATVQGGLNYLDRRDLLKQTISSEYDTGFHHQ